jgi:hypothetical protein
MIKKGGSSLKAAKTIIQKGVPYTPRLFSADLDGDAFDHFHQYWRRRAEAKTQKAEASSMLGKPAESLPPPMEKDILRRLQSIADAYSTFEASRRSAERKAARSRAKVVAALLRKFDACRFDGPDDWICKKSFAEALRKILLEYFSDTRTGAQIRDNGVLVAADSDLSGSGPGGCYFTNPTREISELVIEALFWKSRKALGFLRTLAVQGDSRALQKLAKIVVPLVKLINEKASADGSVLGCYPRGLPYWPVLKSPHHDFDCDHRALLKSLQVGKDYPLTVAEEARWTARDAIGKWAIHLCQTIEIMQEGHCVEEDSEPWEHQLLELQPFSSKTWKDWWKVAKGLLRHDFVDVVEIPELNKTVKSSADRKSVGRIRRRILAALEDKLKSMAWENKVKNVSREQRARS